MPKSIDSFSFLLLSLMLLDGIVQAEEQQEASEAAREKRERAFTEMLANVDLIGTYTQNKAGKE